MSISRKLCFVMSFSFPILYILTMGWLLPCRYSKCEPPYGGILERNLSSIWLVTNVETVNLEGLPSLAILGYAESGELKMAALATNDGSFEWNNILPFIPRKIQCNFGIIFDVNGDGVSDCLLSGYKDIYAFNASNGYVFWNQNFPSDDGNIVSGFHPTMVHDNKAYVIGICGDRIVVLSSHNGTKISEITFPCSAPFDIKIIPNVVDANLTLWNLICDYGDEIEAWGFGERNVLSNENSKNTGHATDFRLLFSRSNFTGSIDLGCDVTPVPGGPLLLSWSDQVVMVTPKATAWDRRFPYPLSVVAITVGHFSDSDDMQVVAAALNGTNTIIYILEITNGSTINTVILKDSQVQSMEKITGVVDALLLKSFSPISRPMYNNSDPIPPTENFVLVDFGGENISIKNIVTTTAVVGSALNAKTDEEVDLLLLVKTEDGYAAFQKYVLYSGKNVLPACGTNYGKGHFSSEI